MTSRSKGVAANRAAIIDKVISSLRQGEDRYIEEFGIQPRVSV